MGGSAVSPWRSGRPAANHQRGDSQGELVDQVPGDELADQGGPALAEDDLGRTQTGENRRRSDVLENGQSAESPAWPT